MSSTDWSVVIGIIGSMFTAVIGGYIWTSRRLSGVYSEITRTKEVLTKGFVQKEVCQVRTEAMQRSLSEIKDRLDTGLTEMHRKLDKLMMNQRE